MFHTLKLSSMWLLNTNRIIFCSVFPQKPCAALILCCEGLQPPELLILEKLLSNWNKGLMKRNVCGNISHHSITSSAAAESQMHFLSQRASARSWKLFLSPWHLGNATHDSPSLSKACSVPQEWCAVWPSTQWLDQLNSLCAGSVGLWTNIQQHLHVHIYMWAVFSGEPYTHTATSGKQA